MRAPALSVHIKSWRSRGLDTFQYSGGSTTYSPADQKNYVRDGFPCDITFHFRWHLSFETFFPQIPALPGFHWFTPEIFQAALKFNKCEMPFPQNFTFANLEWTVQSWNALKQSFEICILSPSGDKFGASVIAWCKSYHCKDMGSPQKHSLALLSWVDSWSRYFSWQCLKKILRGNCLENINLM